MLSKIIIDFEIIHKHILPLNFTPFKKLILKSITIMSSPKTTHYLIIIIIINFITGTAASTSALQENPLMLKFSQWFEDRKNPGPFGSSHQFNSSGCVLAPEIIGEVDNYKTTVNKIMDTILRGNFKGLAYQDLTEFVDLFGHRVSGSEVMDKAVTYLGEKMADMRLSNLHEETTKIPVWSKGIEIAMIIDPFEVELNIRALGLSAETPKEGITAPVLVVHSFSQLEEEKDDVKGRIVIFNSKSGDAQKHILFGPSFAGKYGALAALCRSPIQLVSSSVVMYEVNAPKIPAAVISRDDADKLERMSGRQDDLQILLRLTGQVHKERNSRNVFGDLEGSSLKNEYILLMSHLSSWDQGEGVHDDAIGVILGMLTLDLLKSLGIQPKRSIKMAVFSAEESGFVGTKKWVERHQKELINYSAALEADLGCMKATGLIISGSTDAACILNEIMNQIGEKTGAKMLSKMEGLPSNVLAVHAAGVPMISLNGDDENGGYFEIQHTFLDSLTSVDRVELDKCFAVLASTVYLLAELKEKLPRK